MAKEPAFDLMDELVARVGGLTAELYYAKPYEPPDAADSTQKRKRKP